MDLLLRIAAVAVAGAALFAAGKVNGAVQLRPGALGALFTAFTVAAAIALIALVLTDTAVRGARERLTAALAPWTRATFLFVSAMSLMGLVYLRGTGSPPVHDATTYHNDAMTLNECAAQTLMRGEDPYREFGIFQCYGERRIGADRTTPLRRGAFSDISVYPSEEQLEAVWTARQRELARDLGTLSYEPPDFEFVWRPSYPSLSILLLVPWTALGWDANVLYVLCLLAAMALVLMCAPPPARAFLLTGMLAAISLAAFTVGGSGDLLYALPLVAAWLWRERRWSALALGVAVSTKQLAWPFAAFYLMQVATAAGWREAARRGLVAAGLFAAVNAPFVLWDARAWILGILTPVSEPMFPRGAGLVILSSGGVLPVLAPAVYLALEGLAAALVVALAWRTRRASPELGVALAMVPLYFGWRSLFSYFFLLPLFAFAGLARVPAGDLEPEAARAAGAVTVLAMPPSPRGAPR